MSTNKRISSEKIRELFRFLSEKTRGSPETMVTRIIERYGQDPYLILISCLISLRARDIVTYDIVMSLFKRAQTPKELLAIPLHELEEIIRSSGFYHQKTRTLRSVSQALLDRFDGVVPDTRNELESIKGIGPKTANLVLSEAFDIPAICVDRHVHRIANHLGLVHTETPEETEKALKEIIPKNLWLQVNELFVKWGQNICTPYDNSCECPRNMVLNTKSS
jgi:endonuclease-3